MLICGVNHAVPVELELKLVLKVRSLSKRPPAQLLTAKDERVMRELSNKCRGSGAHKYISKIKIKTRFRIVQGADIGANSNRIRNKAG